MELEGLEPFLLTADEVGEGFLMQESGAVRGAGVGHMCPDAGVSFDEFVAMRAWIVKPSGDDEIAVEELLWIDDTASLDQLMTDLGTAFTLVLTGAVMLYVADNPRGCPTVEDLVNERYLDGSRRTTDAWDTDFQISCEDGDIAVISAGPDLEFNTEDDI